MLIFGHAGITLGAAVTLNGVASKSYYLTTKENKVKELWRGWVSLYNSQLASDY